MQLELVVLRHGRTEWNAGGRFQGHTDVPLDATGRAQARALGVVLADERFDAAYASDLARARETAEIVLEGRDADLELDPRWREMRFGVWEGLTWAEIVARDPALAERSATAPKFYTPDGGESFDECCARVADALATIRARAHDGARVLVATHAGPLHALLRVALGESEAAALAVRFSPASITRLAFDGANARVVELNRTAPTATPA
jgi:broad specificity phosphatase PhoE